ncbi:hypothetical protein D3C71_1419230 [compost metagenome]
MDVRGALADRIHQHLVDELDHRRVVTLGVNAGVATTGHVLVPGADIQIAHLLVVAPQGAADAVIAGQPQIQRAPDLVLINQDRFDHQIGVELDLIQRLRRVEGTHEQLAAALEQRQHLMLAQQLLADQLHRILVGVEHRHIQQRHPEFHGIGSGHVRRGNQLLVRQPLRQRHLGVPGLRHRRTGNRLIQRPVLNQTTGNPGDANQIGGDGGIHDFPWAGR